MRIIQFIANLGSGGAETLVKDLSLEFKRQGQEVLVIVVDRLHQETSESTKILELNRMGITVKSLNRQPGSKSIKPFFELRNLIKDFKPDIVHLHSDIAGYYSVPFLLKKKMKFVQTIHSTLINASLPNALLKLSFIKKRIAKVYCSETANQALCKILGNGPTVLNGILIRQTKNIRAQITQEYAIPPDATILLNVGRIDFNKNQVILPNIVEKLNERIFSGSLYLLICGASKDSVVLSHLTEEVSKMKHSGRVKLLGVRNDILDLMSSVDFYISTSSVEGLPMTGLEAMGTGVPLILSPIEEHLAVFEGEEAVYFPIKNQVEEYYKLFSAESLKPLYKNKIRDKRKEFIQRYSIQNTALEYLRFFLKHEV
ncbi:glycosyltransferase family 4 protein [Pontibacter pamirensis]|uniref:glycosyltransferase family 4 protein n=1 Tax=Pontibacter pamirensis TaxID=2562824 RepID=UPI00138964DC|nr:glycosyltransferase family 4 protein [Pontibacter pamirensis]